MTTVIFHAADYDGIFCREIARKFLPDAELIGWDFADKPLAIPEGQIYILDLPVDRVFGYTFLASAPSWPTEGIRERIIWIDHHASSIASHPTDIPGYRIDGVAACRLAWQWFANDGCKGPQYLPSKEGFINREVPEPLAVRLAGEYDIWDHRGDGDLEFQFGVRSRKLTAHDWSQMLSIERPTIEEVEKLISVGFNNLIAPDGTVAPAVVAGLLKDGATLMRYQQSTDASIIKHKGFIREWEGLKFLCLNTARCNSNTFAAKDIPETGHDALMAFAYNGEKWTVSLYHAAHRKDIDLSKIAVKYGGGGHKGACGFTIPILPFI